VTAVTRDKNFDWRRVDTRSLDLEGMKVAIVGGTGGIGRALSRILVSRGAAVLVVGQTFRDSDVAGIEFIKADLSLMREAQRVGSLLPAETLDLVIFTTGIISAPKRQETPDGIERDMAISYLSRLVIIREIAPRLEKNGHAGSMRPRVFVMGFPGKGQIGTLDDLNAEKKYSAIAAHMTGVAGNEMLVLDSARRYPNVSFFGLNPGSVKSGIRSNWLGANSLKHRLFEFVMGLVAKSADTYAGRIAPLLVSSDLEGHSGAMFDPNGFAIFPSPKLTDDYTKKFILASEALVSRSGIRVAS
jgi:NAD(P)-dependent dehydrogenase (short-subunit alcohol dehydrogenase family)